jgi:hypothetical protein
MREHLQPNTFTIPPHGYFYFTGLKVFWVVCGLSNELKKLINASEVVIWDGLQADVIKFCFDLLAGRFSRDCFYSSFKNLVSSIESFQPSNSKLEHERKCLLIKVKNMRLSVDFIFNIVGSGPDNLRCEDVKQEVNFYIGNVVVS